MSIQFRFEQLREFGEGFTRAIEADIRSHTGISQYRCFVHDEFETNFPEDHLARDQTVMVSLRLSIDLKGFGKASVDLLKDKLSPLSPQLKLLRPNFGDSAEAVDFDWHVGERDREEDEGEKLRARLHEDALILTQTLGSLMGEEQKPQPHDGSCGDFVRSFKGRL